MVLRSHPDYPAALAWNLGKMSAPVGGCGDAERTAGLPGVEARKGHLVSGGKCQRSWNSRFQHRGPKDHVELATSQGTSHPGQPGNTAAEISMPGGGRPTRSIGPFLLDPGDSAPRKKKRERMQNSLS